MHYKESMLLLTAAYAAAVLFRMSEDKPPDYNLLQLLALSAKLYRSSTACSYLERLAQKLGDPRALNNVLALLGMLKFQALGFLNY